MSELFYFPELGLFVNMKHLISARYEPEHDVIDDEVNPPTTTHLGAVLVLVTKELEVETISGFDGELKGAASKSVEIVLKDGVAKRMFERLSFYSETITADSVDSSSEFPF